MRLLLAMTPGITVKRKNMAKNERSIGKKGRAASGTRSFLFAINCKEGEAAFASGFPHPDYPRLGLMGAFIEDDDFGTHYYECVQIQDTYFRYK